jgi:CRP-like cAMP-binding protein
LYHQGEEAKNIFFIYSGQIKLYFDISDFTELKSKDNLRAIMQYPCCSYFGDADIFASNLGLLDRGRDTMAIANLEATLFSMDLNLLENIKLEFPQVYDEMEDLALIRHKKHFIAIYDHVIG